LAHGTYVEIKSDRSQGTSATRKSTQRRFSTKLGPTDVRIVRRMKVFAFHRKLIDQFLQFHHAALGGRDRDTFFAIHIAAGLTRIQPKLQRTRQQPVGDIPEVRFVVAFGNTVAQIDGFPESFLETGVETDVLLLHDAINLFPKT
jgi:hypothetical protein